MIRVRNEVIRRGHGGRAAGAHEAWTTQRTQHIKAWTTHRTPEFDNRILVPAIVALITSARSRCCGAAFFVTGSASIPQEKLSFICLHTTEGTHPIPCTTTTERVLDLLAPDNIIRRSDIWLRSACRTTIIKLRRCGALKLKASGACWRRGAPGKRAATAPAADPTSRDALLERNRMLAQRALPEECCALRASGEVPATQPHTASLVATCQAFLWHR